MIWALVILAACGVVFLGFLVSWWPVLDDPEFFHQRQMEEDDNARFFQALPKPDREWNR